MSCKLCGCTTLEHDQDTNKNVCTSCGFLMDIECIPVVFQSFPCNHVSNAEVLVQEYLSTLKSTWSVEHLDAVEEKLKEYLEVTSHIQKNMILATILKYASEHRIPCNLLKHRKMLRLKTKKLSKSLRAIQAGVISEGLCHPTVRSYIEKHGDPGNIRPVSLLARESDNAHFPKSHVYTQTNQLENIVRVLERNDILLQPCHIQEIQDTILNYSPILRHEGTIMVILLAIYVVAKEHNLVKNMSQYCSIVRLTSPPTLHRLLKIIRK